MFKVQVGNFQSIQDIELTVNGLTVLTAPSHSGKTALVRAMDSLLTSNWFQESYQRQGTSLTTVILTTPTDVIEFTRKGSSTSYKVNGASFSKLGGKVPPELTMRGFGEVQISESATETVTILPQLQNQFDGPYQDTIKPASLTQLLGSFTNLAPYQTGQDRAKKQQAEARRECERLQRERVRTSAITEFLSSFNPEIIQYNLDSANYYYQVTFQSLDTVSKYVRLNKLVKILSHIRNLQTPYSQIPGTKRLVLSCDKANSIILNHYTQVNKVSELLQHKQTLQSSYPTYISPVKNILKNASFLASYSKDVVYQSIKIDKLLTSKASIPTLTQLSQVHTLTKNMIKHTSSLNGFVKDVVTQSTKQAQLLQSKEALPTLTQLAQIHSLQKKLSKILNLNISFTSHLSQIASIVPERDKIASTLSSLASNRATLETSLTDGKCPLCFSSMGECSDHSVKAKKPRSKAISGI